MKQKLANLGLTVSLICLFSFNSLSHDITFCGEKIPISDEFVADKLMNAIRKQVRYINLPWLRQQSNLYFPIVEDLLRRTRLPDDLKYVAIVESGFRNVVSPVGAAGFWQLMPPTALELGLIINPLIDERNDIDKATYAACRVFAQYYLSIRKQYGISSWILAAAAYNVGIGRLSKTIGSQGSNYFRMQLNTETAEYVYKIIAIKELWEHPELYMKNFGYNVFKPRTTEQLKKAPKENDEDIAAEFSSVMVDIDEKDGAHPENIDLDKVKENSARTEPLREKKPESKNIKHVWAKISGKYKKFKDGRVIAIELEDNLQLDNIYRRKGNIIRGVGWLIEDRIFIDLGLGRNLILCDTDGKQGLAISLLKKNEPIILKVNTAM